MGLWELFNESIGPPEEPDLIFILDDAGLSSIDKEYAELGEREGFLRHTNTRRDMLNRLIYIYEVTGQ